eukprot:TRINITY_DN11926_c0_g1_i8.p1 TRINITY_DN11926_c0_g1~~TRINITY_DN11926_c0_g1_i8.p1  ORF type:complete len:406 (-),score=70.85 TRINITY_DN11926_c0_g1_i8:242-1459(-)
MQCPSCKLPYNKETHVPLLLISCGHSLCSECADSLLSQQAIACPECKKPSSVESVEKLPKNLALLLITGNPETLQVCAAHGKRIEGFCEDDKKLLCISCILLDGHKAHEVSPIVQAAAKVRQKLARDVETAKKVEERVRNLMSDVESLKQHLVNTASKKLEETKALYNEIIDIITTRANTLKEAISGVVEKEEESLGRQLEIYRWRLKLIEDFKGTMQVFPGKTDCEVLSEFEGKRLLADQATGAIKDIVFKPRFPDVVRATELSVLWKLFNSSTPQKKVGSTNTSAYKSYNTEKKLPQTPRQSQPSPNIMKKESASRHSLNTIGRLDRHNPFSTPNPELHDASSQKITLDLSKAIAEHKSSTFCITSSRSSRHLQHSQKQKRKAQTRANELACKSFYHNPILKC